MCPACWRHAGRREQCENFSAAENTAEHFSAQASRGSGSVTPKVVSNHFTVRLVRASASMWAVGTAAICRFASVARIAKNRPRNPWPLLGRKRYTCHNYSHPQKQTFNACHRAAVSIPLRYARLLSEGSGAALTTSATVAVGCLRINGASAESGAGSTISHSTFAMAPKGRLRHALAQTCELHL